MFIKHFPRKKTFLPLNDFHRNSLENIPTSLRNSNMSDRKESNCVHGINQILFSFPGKTSSPNTDEQEGCTWDSTETSHFDYNSFSKDTLAISDLKTNQAWKKNCRGHYFLTDDPLLKMDCKNFRHDWIYYGNTELTFEKDKINVYKWRPIPEQSYCERKFKEVQGGFHTGQANIGE